jgi:hypothetical protein
LAFLLALPPPSFSTLFASFLNPVLSLISSFLPSFLLFFFILPYYVRNKLEVISSSPAGRIVEFNERVPIVGSWKITTPNTFAHQTFVPNNNRIVSRVDIPLHVGSLLATLDFSDGNSQGKSTLCIKETIEIESVWLLSYFITKSVDDAHSTLVKAIANYFENSL